MPRFAAFLMVALVAAPGAWAEDRPDNTPPEGFTALFNGKDLKGWVGRPHFDPYKLAEMSEQERTKQLDDWTKEARDHWRVEDGVLINDGKGPYLTTDRDYGDIELYVDWKIGPKGDAGVYLRATPQVQMWDSTEESYFRHGAQHGSGGLWNNSPGAPGKDPLVNADNPIGEWNTLRIIQVGARTTVYLNGKLVVDNAIMENYWKREEPLLAEGPIQLQTHNHETFWKNIYVREIPAEEANKILGSHGNEGFESIFNGKSLDGWAGAVDNYEAVDGTIQCKQGKGGVLYFDKEYSDFQSRLEFLLPPAGNNGLAIRYPGQGNAAVTGMAELQILDDTAERYAKLDPRQYNGSAYGMVPAKRGYLRPVGEWNFQETTVKGSHVKVELNGNVILDADLGEVKEFMNDAKHPGKDRTSGFFGFAGHNDPVQFRNIQMKTLD